MIPALIAQLTEILEQEANMTAAPWSTDLYVIAGIFEEGSRSDTSRKMYVLRK